MTPPIFTVLTLTYNRPHYLKKAVESVLAQTYAHWEMVIIDNAANAETAEYLKGLRAKELRVKIVHFERNQYDPREPLRFMEICCNKALEVISGDFILYLSDDDLIAPDYVEKMVKLFSDNPNCVSACGQAVSVNEYGQVNENFIRAGRRPRYMPGHALVLDVFRGGKTLYSSPGSIFTIRTDVRKKIGGFHESFDFADFVSIIPSGETGFDPSAHFYWRHHDDQLSKTLNDEGVVYIKNNEKVIRDFDLKNRWDAIEPGLGRFVCDHIARSGQRGAANLFCYSLYRFNVKACGKILGQSAAYPYFWRQIPRSLIKNLPHLKSNLLRTAARAWFFILPFTRNLSPGMERIYQKVKAG